MNDRNLDQLLLTLPVPDTDVDADVLRGQRGLRRRRTTIAGLGLAATAVLGGVVWVGISGDDPSGRGNGRDDTEIANSGDTKDTAPAIDLDPLSWEALQPFADHPVFPGDEELVVPLDANTVPALEVLVPLLDPEGAHIRPSSTATNPQIEGGRPVMVTIEFDWWVDNGPNPVDVRLATDKTTAMWECARQCAEDQVDGTTVLSGVTDGGYLVWGAEQPDGEWVTVMFADVVPLSDEQIVDVLTSDIDLPKTDLTPEPPPPAVDTAEMRAIGEEVLNAGDRSIATKVDPDNGFVGGKLTVGGDTSWFEWFGRPTGEALTAIAEEGECAPEVWVECVEREVDGRTYTVKYDDRTPDQNGDGRMAIGYAGPTTYVSVWTHFNGEIGSETPVVPWADIERILFDPRWQE